MLPIGKGNAVDLITFLLNESKQAPKRHIRIYRDEESSEVDWEGESLVKAIKTKANQGDEIFQNGVELAVAKGQRWVLTDIGKGVIAREKAGKDIMHPPSGSWSRQNVSD
jgi:hypothetical protein